jgi:hypothetical protein
MRQLLIESTRRGLVSIGRCPETIRIAGFFDLRPASGERENSFRDNVPEQGTNINHSASLFIGNG